MTLLDNLQKKYKITIRCDNCRKKCTLGIKKGKRVKDAMEDHEITCDNCGCMIDASEYDTEFSVEEEKRFHEKRRAIH